MYLPVRSFLTIIILATLLTEIKTAGINEKISPRCSDDIKSYRYLLNRGIFPDSIGSVHTLSCPIMSKELENELLCGLDPKFSTGNVILYSGLILNTLVPNYSITCIDLILKNDKLLINFDSDIIWHGKCFASILAATEVYLNHELFIEFNNSTSSYKMNSQGENYYSIELPPLLDSRYISIDLGDRLLSTAHSHIFDSFFNSSSFEYCPVPEKRTMSIMNINFSKMLDKIYVIKTNANEIKINPKISNLFGLVNRFDETTLDTSKCSASFLKDITSMETRRAVNIENSFPVPPKPGSKSLSKASEFPAPFDHMCSDVIDGLTVSKSAQAHKLDWNELLFEFQKR